MNELFYKRLCESQAAKIADWEQALETSKQLIESYEKQTKIQEDLIIRQQELIGTFREIKEEAEHDQT